MKEKLIVYSSPIPATYIAGPAIAKLIKRFPDCQVQLKTNDQKEFRQISQVESFDLGIFDISSYKSLGQFDCEFLLSSTAKLCCRKSHPLFERELVEAEDILKFPIATPFALQEYVVHEINRILGLPIVEGRCEVNLTYDSLVTVRHALIHSDMIAIAPSLALSHSLSSELRALEVADWPMMEAEFGIVTKTAQSMTPLANAFIDELFEIVQQIQ